LHHIGAVEAAFGADLLHDIEDLGMGTGGDADADPFGLGSGRKQGRRKRIEVSSFEKVWFSGAAAGG